MLFTQGKDRFYERMMQEKPNWSNGREYRKRGSSLDFKYTYADMACEYCSYYNHCPFDICPKIMENIDDLVGDNDFFLAVEYAEKCATKHKHTLLLLREQFDERPICVGC